MRLFHLVVFLLLTSQVLGQSNFKLFGGPQTDEGQAIIECSNSDIVVGGVTSSYGAGGKDILLTRLTQNGQIIWSKSYGFLNDERDAPMGLYETANGDILCSFRSHSLGQSQASVLMRIDNVGNIVWQKQISTGSNSEWTRTIFEHDDGSIYVGNTVNAQLFGSSDAVITKLDPSGNLIWSKTIGVGGNDHIWSISPLPNDEIILNMNSQQLGPGSRSAVLVKMDSNGNILSQVAYGGSSLELASDVVFDPNVGYLVAGGTTSYGQGSRDAFVALFDINFNLQWFKTYGGPLFDQGATVEIIDNNHFALYFNSEISGSFDQQLSIAGMDAAGNTLYNKSIGNGFDQYVSNNASNTMVHSNTLNRTYFTGAYTNLNGNTNILFASVDGGPQNLCSDTTIQEANHTPFVSSVNFNIASLGFIQNINLTTSVVNPTEEVFCLCPILPVTLSDTTICSGTSLQYNLDPNLNYQWMPAGDFSCSNCPDPIFVGNDTTQVTLVVDNTSCYDTSLFTINLNPSNILTLSGPDTLCSASSPVNLDANNVQGYWAGPGIADSISGSFDPSGISGDVEVIFNPTNQCTVNDTLELYVESVISGTITSNMDTICFNSNTDTLFSLNANPSNGYWSGTAIYDSVNGYFDENFINSGPQMIYYTPYGGCVESDSIEINVLESQVASILQQDTLCEFDDEVDLAVNNNYSGTWSGNGIVDMNSGIFDPDVANTGINTIVFNPENKCIENDTIEVIVDSMIIADIFMDDTMLCIDSDAILLNASPSNGSWSGFIDSVANSLTYFSPYLNGTGNYSVYYTPSEKCSVTDSVLITVSQLNVQVQDSLITCGNTNAFISYSPAGGVWSGQNASDVIQGDTLNPSFLESGVYEYVYTVNNGCLDSDTLVLTVLETPSVNLGNDTTICEGCELVLNPGVISSTDSVFWSTDSTNESIIVDSEGFYSVYVENEYGCVDSSNIFVDVQCESTLYIPNTFTPDDSGLNDLFKVYGENVSIKSFEVYNRWGDRIYSAQNEPVNWEGTYKGSKVKDGVYIYKVIYTQCKKELTHQKVGHIVVLK